MQIKLNNVFVNDQEEALKFYTEKLGFVKKQDIPMGEFKWLTVVSPEGPNDVELLLEPMGFEFAKTYQAELFNAGIPIASFFVDDIQAEYEKLKGLGVEFKSEPTKMGDATTAVLNDTCGNYIQIYSVDKP